MRSLFGSVPIGRRVRKLRTKIRHQSSNIGENSCCCYRFSYRFRRKIINNIIYLIAHQFCNGTHLNFFQLKTLNLKMTETEFNDDERNKISYNYTLVLFHGAKNFVFGDLVALHNAFYGCFKIGKRILAHIHPTVTSRLQSTDVV